MPFKYYIFALYQNMKPAGILRSITIGFILFLSITGYSVGPSYNTDLVVVGDSVIVRKTLLPGEEKDEVVILHKGGAVTIYTIYTEDGSSVEFIYDYGDFTDGYGCFEAYNAAAGGSSFLFYKWPENRLYITCGIYSEFDPLPGSVDFNKKELLLKNLHCPPIPRDTLDLGDRVGYIFTVSDMIRVEFRQVWPLP